MLDPVLDPIPKHVNAIHEQNEFVHVISKCLALLKQTMQTMNLCTSSYTCLVALVVPTCIDPPLLLPNTRESPFTQTRIWPTSHLPDAEFGLNSFCPVENKLSAPLVVGGSTLNLDKRKSSVIVHILEILSVFVRRLDLSAAESEANVSKRPCRSTAWDTRAQGPRRGRT